MKLLKSKGFRHFIWGLQGLLLGLIVYAFFQLIDPVPIAELSKPGQPIEFAGRVLLVASDADMVATAYADAKLDRIPGVEDTLSAIALPLNAQSPAVAQVQVSNSVMSWPQIIATSPDGKVAYVVEVRGKPPEGVQEYQSIEEMPEGSRLTVVDMNNPAKPAVVESTIIGRNPEHISLSPNGELLAIDLEEVDRELLILQTNNGKLGKPYYFSIDKLAAQPAKKITSVTWHPSGRFLALHLDNQKVAFYQVQLNNTGEVILNLYGKPIEVGNHTSVGKFTPDGRFYLIPDLKWRTWGLVRQLNFLLNPKGEMIAIRFDINSENSPEPEIVSRVEVGLSPEGFAISPNGLLVATVNMRRTYLSDFPPAWRGKSHSSLSLVQLNQDSGKLTAIGEYGFEGLLPEDAVFDATGESLAVAIYNYREKRPRTGAIEFWRVVQRPKPKLERTGFKIEVTRGPHTMALIR